MWGRVICLCLSLSALTNALDVTKDNRLNYYGIYDGRPRTVNIAISRGLVLNGVQTPMARHHIIPYSTLRDFFNAVVKYHNRLLHSSLFTFIRRLGEIAQIDTPELKENDYQLQFEMLMQTNNLLRLPFDNSNFLRASPHVRKMQALFTWMPFNIFEGPAPDRRSNDPGSNFESDSGEIIGSEMLQGVRYLDSLMRAFISWPTPIGSQAIEQLIALFEKRHTPYFFNPNNWFARHPLAGSSNPQILFEIKSAINRVEQQQHPERLSDVTVH